MAYLRHDVLPKVWNDIGHLSYIASFGCGGLRATPDTGHGCGIMHMQDIRVSMYILV